MKFFVKLFSGIIILCLFIMLGFNVYQNHKIRSYTFLGKNVVYVIGEEGMGTGFHVKTPNNKIYILTNRHVCNTTKSNTIMVKDEFMDRPIPRRIIEKFGKHDLCLVEPLENREGLKLADENVETWENVTIIGHPVGGKLDKINGLFVDSPTIEMPMFNISTKECLSYGGTELTLSKEQQAILKFFYGINSICIISYKTNMFNVNVYGGNSGSPVLNDKYEVVSVIFAGTPPSYNRESLSVPLEFVKDFLKNY